MKHLIICCCGSLCVCLHQSVGWWNICVYVCLCVRRVCADVCVCVFFTRLIAEYANVYDIMFNFIDWSMWCLHIEIKIVYNWVNLCCSYQLQLNYCCIVAHNVCMLWPMTCPYHTIRPVSRTVCTQHHHHQKSARRIVCMWLWQLHAHIKLMENIASAVFKYFEENWESRNVMVKS